MFWGKASKVGLLGVLPLAAAFQPAQEPTVFHSGTRLVEVEVIVRDQPIRPPGVRASLAYFLDSGPPFGPPGALHKGLTKDDFTLLDQGQPQSIAIFRVGLTGAGSSGGDKPVLLPPGAVSNRQDNRGHPVNGASAVLVDFLNTRFGCRGYERQGLTKFLRSAAATDTRMALYTLGENLRMLYDFTDDPQKLKDAAARLEQRHGQLPRDLAAALRDLGDVISVDGGEADADRVHAPMTLKALRVVIQHLAGVPGRKNLVWLMEDPRRVPPAAMVMAQQANIVLYPVVVRTVGGSFGPDASCVGVSLGAARDLAAVTGGRAFFDVLDLNYAVQSTEEDAGTAYVLGYYPAENMLDGKYHTLTVKLHGKAPDKQPLEVRYRPGYLATKVALPPPAPTPQELFAGRVNSARIGLTAEAAPQPRHPGLYDVRVTVDLHDIHLEQHDGHFTGAFDLSVPNPATKGTVRTGTIAIDLLEKQVAAALESGFVVNVGGAEAESGEVRVVVRDRATGIAGSLRVPVPIQ